MQKMMRATAALLVLLTLLTMIQLPEAEAAKTYTGTITKDRIFFRSRATTRSGYILRFTKGDKVTVSGIVGNFYKVTFKGKTGYVMCDYVKLSASAKKALAKQSVKATATPKPKATATPKPKATATPKPKATATPKATQKTQTQSLKWFNTGRNLFKRNSTFTVKDVATGKTWECKVMYGTNHLDAEPLTKADTAKMKAACGGRFTYKRRAILVKYKGKVYAASMYPVPHGDQTITDNGYEGQFCIHFTGSKTHGSDKVDADHQAAIEKALKATW